MKPATNFILACALYVVFLGATAPAWLLSAGVAAATGGKATVDGARGTLWRGSAAVIVHDDRTGGAVRYEGLRWELLWHRLLHREIAAHVQIKDARARGEGNVAVRNREIRVTDAAFEMQAAQLASHFPMLAAIRPAGALEFAAHDFSYGEDSSAGEIVVAWKHASSGIAAAEELGEYRARITGAGAGVEFQVTSSRAILHMEGRGGWTRKEGAWYDGVAHADPAFRASLAPLLRTLGSDAGDGPHRVRLNRERTRAN